MTQLRRVFTTALLLGTVALAAGRTPFEPAPEAPLSDLSPIRVSRVQTSPVSGSVTCSNDGILAMRCDWEDSANSIRSRSFDAWLWAPLGGQAKAAIPVNGSSPEDGLNLESGYLLMQGVTGTRPRSKSGGGRATGNGTTIVLFAGTRNGQPYYRAACIEGTTQVDFLRRELGRNNYEDLAGQIIKGGYYIEWDGNRVTATNNAHHPPRAVIHRISSDSAFNANIQRLLNRARVTPG